MRGATLLMLALATCPVAGAQAVRVTFRVPGETAAGLRAFVAPADAPHAETPAQAVALNEGSIEVSAVAGRDVVVRFARADGGPYYLAGPMRWPDRHQVLDVAPTRYRTVAGRLPAKSEASAAPVFLGGEPEAPWPRCVVSPNRWLCVGVPADARGVLVFPSSPYLHYGRIGTDAEGGSEVPIGRAAWLVVLHVQADDPGLLEGGVDVQFLRPSLRGVRAGRTRHALEPVPQTTVERVSGATFVIAGSDPAAQGVLQVRGKHIALEHHVFVAAEVSWQVPLVLVAAPPVSLSGRVIAAAGGRARGVQMQLWEIVREAGGGTRSAAVRRYVRSVPVTQDGRFEVLNLSRREYELFAIGPQGRASTRVTPPSRPLTLRLDAGVRVSGRVLRNGMPVAEASVTLPAGHDVIASAFDPSDAVGFPTTTDRDGHFTIAVPPAGASEIRVEHGGSVVRRSLPQLPPGGVVHLGNLELPGNIAVLVTLHAGDGCALAAAGPVGRSGMVVIAAERAGPDRHAFTLPEPGPWYLRAICGGRELPIEPGVMEVPQDVTHWSTFGLVRREPVAAPPRSRSPLP